MTSGSIGSYADEMKLQAFLQSLEGVPCVLMGDRRDGFALLTEYTGEELEDLKYRVYNVFRVFNAGTDKAYNVMVSAGFYVIGKDSETELADALAFADEKLYIEKQNRPKVVAKDAEV